MTSRRAAVGYRFHPTDQELVTHFLKHKMDGNDSLVDSDIGEIDLCKHEPGELPSWSAQQSDEHMWYFFCRRDYTLSKSRRVNRATRAGFWKATGRDRKITAKGTNKVIATKKTLVFYKRRVPNGERTNWVIHEYQPVPPILPNQRGFVLCKLKKNPDENERNDASTSSVGEPSCPRASDSGNYGAPDATPQVGPQLREALDSDLLDDHNGVDADFLAALRLQLQEEQGLFGPLYENLAFDSSDHDCDGPQPQFDTSRQEEDPIELADSFLVDREDFFWEETVHTHHVAFKSLNAVNVEEDGDTDIEVIHPQYNQVLQISNLNDGHASSKEYQQMQTVQTLTETLPSSDADQYGRGQNGFHYDEILALETSALASATHRPESPPQICCLFAIDDELSVNECIREPQCWPRSSNSQEDASRKIKLQIGSTTVFKDKQTREVVENNSASDLSQKIEWVRKMAVEESNKDWKMGKESSVKSSSKPRFYGSTENKRTGSFILWETPLQSHRPSPPSLYLVNTLVGLILFTVVIRFGIL